MTTKAELEKQLGDYSQKHASVLKQLEKLSAKHDPIKHKDEVRAQIALFVVKAYFYILAGALVFIPLYNRKVGEDLSIDLMNLLTALSGFLGTAFGFVVGYYFKESEK